MFLKNKTSFLNVSEISVITYNMILKKLYIDFCDKTILNVPGYVLEQEFQDIILSITSNNSFNFLKISETVIINLAKVRYIVYNDVLKKMFIGINMRGSNELDVSCSLETFLKISQNIN